MASSRTWPFARNCSIIDARSSIPGLATRFLASSHRAAQPRRSRSSSSTNSARRCSSQPAGPERDGHCGGQSGTSGSARLPASSISALSRSSVPGANNTCPAIPGDGLSARRFGHPQAVQQPDSGMVRLVRCDTRKNLWPRLRRRLQRALVVRAEPPRHRVDPAVDPRAHATTPEGSVPARARAAQENNTARRPAGTEHSDTTPGCSEQALAAATARPLVPAGCRSPTAT